MSVIQSSSANPASAFVAFVRAHWSVLQIIRDSNCPLPARWKSLELTRHPESRRIEQLFNSWIKTSKHAARLASYFDNVNSSHWLNLSFSFVGDVDLLLALNRIAMLGYHLDDILEDNTELVPEVCQILDGVEVEVEVRMASPTRRPLPLKFSTEFPEEAHFCLEIVIQDLVILSRATQTNLVPAFKEYVEAIRSIREHLRSKPLSIEEYYKLRTRDIAIHCWSLFAIACIKYATGIDMMAMEHQAETDSILARSGRAMVITQDLLSLPKHVKKCEQDGSVPVNVISLYHRDNAVLSLLDIVTLLQTEREELLEGLYTELRQGSLPHRLFFNYFVGVLHHLDCKRYRGPAAEAALSNATEVPQYS